MLNIVDQKIMNGLLLPTVQISTSLPAYSFCGSRTASEIRVFPCAPRSGSRPRAYR